MGGETSFPIVQLPKDRIIIVTGANSGTGYSIAKWTAMMGATVIMACRSEERAKQAMFRMNEEFLAEKAKGTRGLLKENALRLEFMRIDLTSLKSVIEFTETFKQSGRPLHVLFCNAGIAFVPYAKTVDGFETVFQVNYLSQFLMACKLLPVMKKSGPDCRILLMSSIAHFKGNFDLKKMNFDGPRESYSGFDSYGRSKLSQIMQMYSMDRRLRSSNVTINSIHPGIVHTNLGSTAESFTGKFFRRFCLQVSIGPERATKCSINCAVNPDLSKTSGVYFHDNKRKRTSGSARNKTYQELLWKQTFEYLKPYVTEQEIATMEGK